MLPPKHCPECGEEYLHTVALCAECGVALVLAGESVRVEPDELPPVSQLVRVRSAGTSWARSFSDLLTDTGIAHRLELEPEAEREAGVPRGERLCSVFVREADVAEAARLDAIHLRTQIPDVPDQVAAGGDDRCPACGEAADLTAPECASCGLAFRDAE